MPILQMSKLRLKERTPLVQRHLDLLVEWDSIPNGRDPKLFPPQHPPVSGVGREASLFIMFFFPSLALEFPSVEWAHTAAPTSCCEILGHC